MNEQMLSGSESKQRARQWPYPRRGNFERALRRTAAEWFRSKNYPTHGRYPFILDDWDNWSRNIILPDVAAYIESERQIRQKSGDGFPLHKYIHHGLSSQAMLFNLLGPLILRNDFGPLQEVVEAKGVVWPTGSTVGEFEVEDRSVFNENYGQPTSVDFVVRGESGPTLYIEGKLIESGFGGCSVFADGDCDGRNPMNDLAGCYLHHIGRLYWSRLAEHGLHGLAAGPVCPMTLYYQFFREVLFALHMQGNFVLLHDERSPSFCCAGPMGPRGAFARLAEQVPVQHQSQVACISIQGVVDAVKRGGRHQDWVHEFQLKYGL